MVKVEKKQIVQAEPSPRAMSLKKKYKGVRMRSWGSWVSEIRAPNQKTRIWLGSYSTAEAAARAYDAALICLKGTSATNLNFPPATTTNNNDIPSVMSPKSIQRVAAAAANAFVTPSTTTITTGTSTTTASLSPPTYSLSSPSSSLSSYYSPSLSSSPISNHMIEDEISLVPTNYSFDTTTTDHGHEHMSMVAPWYNFDSPKYFDMINGAFFDPTFVEDVYDEGDLRLWNFC